MTAPQLTISVALCTHEGAPYVEEQVASILAQTVLPFEIVLSDDASTDGTVELVEALVAESESVSLRVIRNERPLGVVKNFEQAVLATRGDLVVLSDQDDRWHAEKLARATTEFAADPALILLASNAELVDAAGEPTGITLFDALEATPAELAGLMTGRAFDVLIRRNLALGATMVFRRELLENAVPFAPGWVHDEWLAIIAAALAPGAVKVIPDVLLDYRQHGANQIGARKLSVGGKISRLREGRSDRNERLRVGAEALRDRLETCEVDPKVQGLADVKAQHERVRSGYPASRVKRLVPVFREWRSGRYRVSGHGWAAVVADLLQPAG